MFCYILYRAARGSHKTYVFPGPCNFNCFVKQTVRLAVSDWSYIKFMKRTFCLYTFWRSCIFIIECFYMLWISLDNSLLIQISSLRIFIPCSLHQVLFCSFLLPFGYFFLLQCLVFTCCLARCISNQSIYIKCLKPGFIQLNMAKHRRS